MRKLLAGVVVAALGLPAGGCGSDAEQRNAYVDAVNRAQNDFAASFRNVSSRVGPTATPAEGRRALRGFRAAVDQVLQRLEAIDVPEKVRPLHRRLVAEIAGYRGAFGKAEAAYRSGDPQRILGARSALVSATNAISARINATIDAINRRLKE